MDLKSEQDKSKKYLVRELNQYFGLKLSTRDLESPSAIKVKGIIPIIGDAIPTSSRGDKLN